MTDEVMDETAVTEDVPDSVEFLSTGRVRFVMDGRTYNMRLPKHGEYKRLRLLGLDIDKATEAEAQFDLLETWVSETFKTLSDRQLPDASDDWPTWLPTAPLVGRLLVHWRDIPLAPGAPGAAGAR